MSKRSIVHNTWEILMEMHAEKTAIAKTIVESLASLSPDALLDALVFRLHEWKDRRVMEELVANIEAIDGDPRLTLLRLLAEYEWTMRIGAVEGKWPQLGNRLEQFAFDAPTLEACHAYNRAHACFRCAGMQYHDRIPPIVEVLMPAASYLDPLHKSDVLGTMYKEQALVALIERRRDDALVLWNTSATHTIQYYRLLAQQQPQPLHFLAAAKRVSTLRESFYLHFQERDVNECGVSPELAKELTATHGPDVMWRRKETKV